MPTRARRRLHRAIVYENDIDHVGLTWRAGEGRHGRRRTSRCWSGCIQRVPDRRRASRSMRCDCGEQLSTARMRSVLRVRGQGRAALSCNQEGRGIGLEEQRFAPTGSRTARGSTRSRPTSVWASRRTCATTAIGAQILVDLGVQKMRMHHEQSGEARRPSRATASRSSSRVSLEIQPNEKNLERYLRTKKEKLGHRLSSV